MRGCFGLFAHEPRYDIASEWSGIASIRNELPDEIDQLRWGLNPNWVDDVPPPKHGEHLTAR